MKYDYTKFSHGQQMVNLNCELSDQTAHLFVQSYQSLHCSQYTLQQIMSKCTQIHRFTNMKHSKYNLEPILTKRCRNEVHVLPLSLYFSLVPR